MCRWIVGFVAATLSATPAAAGYLVANTGLTTPGSLDPNYTLVSVPAGVVNNGAYRISTPDGTFPLNGPWLPNSASTASNWISAFPNVNIPNGGPDNFGVYNFQTTFNLGSLDPNFVRIVGRLVVDNSVEVRLNGNTVIGPGFGGFSSWNSFTITSGFISGVNTLNFLVNNGNNTSDRSGPIGIRVEADLIAPTPAPPTVLFGLFALPLFGAARLRRRAAAA